jgi:CheY-like chemotaxis protein
MVDMLCRALGEIIEIKTVLYESLWRISVDPGQLENAVLNVVINARDAMPDGGALTISTSNVTLDSDYVENKPAVIPGDYVLLAISDTGTGIAPDVLEKAFDPFFTTKDLHKGTGLGLSMVWGFVDQSGGHVTIDSELGRGTSFSIYLPRCSDAVTRDDDNLDLEPVTGGDETILVVDDDDGVRAIAVLLLRDLGYDVLEADDGEDALAILEQHDDVDLLFTDVMMPRMRGPVLAEKAGKLRPNMTVLFTSGYTESVVMYRGARLDSARFLSKPYDRKELARKIRYVLSKGAEE